jgi:hypothetical protein
MTNQHDSVIGDNGVAGGDKGCEYVTPKQPSGIEATKLLWEEYKLRQTHYWSSFNRYALSVITISVIPYVKPDVVKPLDELVLVFPVVGILLSLACCWLLGAEYQRLRMVRQKYDELLTKRFQPTRMPQDGLWDRLVAHRIGKFTSLVFGLGLSIFEVVNALLLRKLM